MNPRFALASFFLLISILNSKADLLSYDSPYFKTLSAFGLCPCVEHANSFCKAAYDDSLELQRIGLDALGAIRLGAERDIIFKQFDVKSVPLNEFFYINLMKELEIGLNNLSFAYANDVLTKIDDICKRRSNSNDETLDSLVSLLKQHCHLLEERLALSSDYLIAERYGIIKSLSKTGSSSLLASELSKANRKELGLLIRMRAFKRQSENSYFLGLKSRNFRPDTLREFKEAIDVLQHEELANDGEALSWLAELYLRMNNSDESKKYVALLGRNTNLNYFKGHFNGLLILSTWAQTNQDIDIAIGLLDQAQNNLNKCKRFLVSQWPDAKKLGVNERHFHAWDQFLLSNQRVRLYALKNKISVCGEDLAYVEDFVYHFSILFSQGSEDYEYLRLRDIFGFSLYNTGFLSDNTEKLAQYSIFTKGLLKELRGDSKIHDSSKKTKFGTYILDDIIKKNPRIGANTKDILSAIQEKQALVDFIKCDSFTDEKGFSRPIYLALLYSKYNKEPITRVFLGNAESIDEQIRIYNSAILLEGDDETLVSSSRRLYSYLIEPLFSFLEKDLADLIICPDSVLGNVSFGSLFDSTGKFLSENFNIVYVSSPRSLLNQRTQDLGVLNYKGYIFSNPTISQPLNKIFLSGLQSFRGLIGNKELPFSFKEGQEAETFMNSFFASNKQVSFKAKHFSGNQANINNFIGMDNPFLIHMACHGFFNEFINPDTRTISSSGLLLSASPLEIDNKTTTTKYTSTKTFLSPEDIAMCNFNNCYLAIISACDSGRGTTFNGEGLIGLQSAFQRAGVANLLLCIWPIGDKDSYIFMSDLYKEFEEQGIGFESFNKTYKEALRRHSKQHGLANAIRTIGPYIWISQSVLNTEQGVPKEL